MKNWWLYHYFPTTLREDTKRYWNKEEIFEEFTIRGYDGKVEIHYKKEHIHVKEYVSHALNRDIAVLILIDDKDYNIVEKMLEDLNQIPEHSIVNDFC